MTTRGGEYEYECEMEAIYRIIVPTKLNKLVTIGPMGEFVQDFSICGHNASRIICPFSVCNRYTPLNVHVAAHQRSFIVIIHIMQLLKVIGVTLGQTPRELSVP